jgi:hypothetical protein
VLKAFYGVVSPLTAMAAFMIGFKDAQAGALLMLGAILFHMWSQEED